MKLVAAILLCLAPESVLAQSEGPFRPRPPAPEPAEPDTIRDRVLFERIRKWVDQRFDERAKEQMPSDQEIESAVNDAINGVEPKQGPGSTIARIVAKVVWKTIQIAVGAALIALIVSHPWVSWSILAGAVAAVAFVALIVADIRVRASQKESK